MNNNDPRIFFDTDRNGFYDEFGRSMGPGFFVRNYAHRDSFEQMRSGIIPQSAPAPHRRNKRYDPRDAEGRRRIRSYDLNVGWARAPKGSSHLDPAILPVQGRTTLGQGSISRVNRIKDVRKQPAPRVSAL